MERGAVRVAPTGLTNEPPWLAPAVVEGGWPVDAEATGATWVVVVVAPVV